MVKSAPQIPAKVLITPLEGLIIGGMALVQIILWAVMMVAGIHILLFWAITLCEKGMFEPSAIQYSVLVAVGAYFCLIVDKDKINKALNIKTELPFIQSHPKAKP